MKRLFYYLLIWGTLIVVLADAPSVARPFQQASNLTITQSDTTDTTGSEASQQTPETQMGQQPDGNAISGHWIDGRITIDWKISLVGIVVALAFIWRIFVYIRGVKRAGAEEIEKLKQRFDKSISELELKQQQVLDKQRLEMQEESEKRMATFRADQEEEKVKAQERAKITIQKTQRAEKAGSAEEIYRDLLQEKLGYITLLGHQELDDIPVNLEDVFVSLRISKTGSNEHRLREKDKAVFLKHSEQEALQEAEYLDAEVEPAELLRQALKGDNRLLLLIGDPGSGKTTVMKYYTLSCLNAQKRKSLELDENILPLFLPLRELDLENQKAGALIRNLANWGGQYNDVITEEVMHDWIEQRPTLVLLDGLDEISDPKMRVDACRVIEKFVAGFQRAKVVVTTRWAGYGKGIGVYLRTPHVRADIKDFSAKHQQEFLRNWFFAVLKKERESSQPILPEIETALRREAVEQADPIITYLEEEENRAIQKLVEVPLLLQILAFIWKYRRYRPRDRSSLYRAAMSYVVADRDRDKNLPVPLSTDDALRILKPVALYMQEKLRQDFAEKEELIRKLQEELATLPKSPRPEVFCDYLRNRAGIFNDYRKSALIFRHKSFMEYLAGLQLREVWHEPERMKQVANCLDDSWWEETLRFFMSEATPAIFDKFMTEFFANPKSRELAQRERKLLLQLVKDAPQSDTNGLINALNKAKSEIQAQSIIDCLKTIDNQAAYQALKQFAEQKSKLSSSIRYAVDAIKASKFADLIEVSEKLGLEPLAAGPESIFRNPVEYNAEYILIPGGKFTYSVSKNIETVPDIYFAKYPVTNKRYRRFIRYLAQEEGELNEKLPWKTYAEQLRAFAESIKGFNDNLPEQPIEWSKEFRSTYDEEKRFNGEDQPVVRISWYHARAYCLWLSLLELSGQGKDLKLAGELYRLPTEMEWEWAAAGREAGGKLRKYPWRPEKGEPNDKLANYNNNVGATTNVGNYPEGATPEGLLDMAGNVWEWCENLYGKDAIFGEGARSLRGGSWVNVEDYLPCSARYGNRPVYRLNNFGFRVVRASSK